MRTRGIDEGKPLYCRISTSPSGDGQTVWEGRLMPLNNRPSVKNKSAGKFIVNGQ